MVPRNTLEASSSSSTLSWTYDVFLSFYGEDTREGFTDHLHAALKQKGIISFRDNEKLKRGKYISQELFNAIQESQYAIVVVSKRYAFSKWCLIELTKILECMTETALTVLPIFYHVDPSNVRKQKGSFEQAFAMHGEDPKVNKEQIKKWRAAMNAVGNLVGWHIDNSYEAIVVEEITRKILDESRCNSSNIPEGLVGIGRQIKKVISLLFLGLDNVQFIGICGIGGIGKTTLAKVIYDQVSPQFEASCFIADVRKKTQNYGVVHLQTQLICKILSENGLRIWDTFEGIDMIAKRIHNKKVFIVLDDVDTEDQLKALIGNRCWFGQGSKVILTSRDLHLLKKYVDNTYEVEELNDYEALELFSWKAFKKDHPEENYVGLCIEFMRYAQGLPLALEILGSFLFGRTMDAWIAARDQLKENPKAEILDKLKISFDALEDSQKHLFLDIACLFDGMFISKDNNKLKCLGNYLAIDIEVLKDKCLIKDFGGTFWMHDLLKKLGQQIVYYECPIEPGRRSRLWCYEDIIHILKYNTGTNSVEVLDLDLSLHIQEQLNIEAFSKMKRLRMLTIHNYQSDDKFHALEWYGDPSNFMLSNQLRYLEWFGYPLENLPINFQAKNIVVLKVPYSCIKQLREWKNFDKVKFIDMSYSCNLMEIADVSGMPNLIELDLQHCTSLSKVHSSLGFLKQLKRLDMEGCLALNSLPNKIDLESLEYLNLVGCSKLEKFPEIVGNMRSLEFLNLIGTNIKQFPLSIKSLSSLKYLNLCGSLSYRKFREEPIYIDAGDLVSSIKKKFSKWQFMIKKKVGFIDDGSNVPHPYSSLLPNVLSSLTSLEELDLSYHNLSDTDIFCELNCLSSIKFLNLSGNKLTTIPNSIYQLPKLRALYLRNCSNLRALSELLFSRLSCLEVLDLGYCNILDGMIPDDFGCLSLLKALVLSGNKFRKIPDLIQLSRLYKLCLDDCTELEALPKLPLGLTTLDLENCLSLKISRVETNEGLSNDFSLLVVRFDVGRPYKILQLPSYLRIVSSSKWARNGVHVENIVAPALVSGIPDWFNQRITSSFGAVQSCFLGNRLYDWGGFALLVLYQVDPNSFHGKIKKQKVDEGGNSSYGIYDGNNLVLPQFLCHFQINEVGIKESLLLSAPEVSSLGPNAFWVFINYHWLFRHNEEFHRKGFGALHNACLEASIESCHLNVEVECGTRSVYWDDISELAEVMSDISPHCMDFATCERLLRYPIYLSGLFDGRVLSEDLD